jgi:hypothetical protein
MFEASSEFVVVGEVENHSLTFSMSSSILLSSVHWLIFQDTAAIRVVDQV